MGPIRVLFGFLLLVSLILAGCSQPFSSKSSTQKHAFEAAEGTILNTGTGLIVSVPPAATEGEMELTVVYDPKPKQLGEGAIALRFAYDIALVSKGGSSKHPPVTLTFKVPEDVDPLCVIILQETEEGWVPAESQGGLPGGDISSDGNYITLVREQLSRYAVAEWLYTHVLKYVEKLPQPPPLPPEVITKGPKDVRGRLVVEATIKSPTILKKLLPSPGIGVWRYVSIEDIENLVSVKGYGSTRYPDADVLKMGFLGPGEEEDLILTFDGSGGHATIGFDINKEALSKAAFDWAIKLGVIQGLTEAAQQENVATLMGLFNDIIDHFSRVESANWKDMLWFIKRGLWTVARRLVGWKAGFWVNILPVAFDMASTAIALIDGRAHHRFPISVEGANQAPVAIITSPSDGSSFTVGEIIHFDGSDSHDPDGEIVSYTWNFGDGVIEEFRTSGETVEHAYGKASNYTVTLTVEDRDGATDVDSVMIRIRISQPPTVSILSPLTGSVFSQGELVTFKGSATDPEDGSLTGSSLVWSSNIDGQIGTGNSFARSDLSVGTHTITLTARDSQGAIGTASITTIIASPTKAEWEDKGQWPYGRALIEALATAPDGSIWAASNNGYTARWDGTRWVDEGQWPHGDEGILALTAAPDGSIWAAGEHGFTARWDGTRWVDTGQWPHGGDMWIFALTAGPDGSIWAAGSGGYTARWDGTGWVNTGQWPCGTVMFGIRALTTALDGSIWAAGDEGCTARFPAIGHQGATGTPSTSTDTGSISGCMVVVQAGDSIQAAINEAHPGTVICLTAGNWVENIRITKSLTLRGAGPANTAIKGQEEGQPIILIESDRMIRVVIEELTISESRGKLGYEYGYGIQARKNAEATVQHARISDNDYDGLAVADSAKVTLIDTIVSGNGGDGVSVEGSATVNLIGSTVSGNRYQGIWVKYSKAYTPKASLHDSTISGNRYNGLQVDGAASVHNCVIEKNGWNGITVTFQSQTTIADSIIRNNAYWGVGAALKKCGEYAGSAAGGDLFNGQVILENNQIYDNKRGDVCLP